MSAEATRVGQPPDRIWVVDATFENQSPKEITATRINTYVGNRISSGKVESPVSATIEGINHDVGGRYVEHSDWTLTEGEVTFRIEFTDEDGTNFEPDEGDFFVLSVVSEEGGLTERYFIQMDKSIQ